MTKKILKFIYKEIKEAFTPKWSWLLIYVPAVILGMALFIHDRILFPPPPPPTITYTPPKWNFLEKWMEQQKEKFDNQKRQHQS